MSDGIDSTLFSVIVKTLLQISCVSFDSSESDSASWEISQVTLKDEGYYECIAINSAGTGRARTFLDVSGMCMVYGK